MCNKGISFLSPICLCMISLIVLKRRKNQEEKKKQKESKCLYMIANVFSRRCKSDMM